MTSPTPASAQKAQGLLWSWAQDPDIHGESAWPTNKNAEWATFHDVQKQVADLALALDAERRAVWEEAAKMRCRECRVGWRLEGRDHVQTGTPGEIRPCTAYDFRARAAEPQS